MNLRAPLSPRLAGWIGGYLAGLFEMDLALAPPIEAARYSNSYSTVTLLARLRGWSTSVPLATAV